MGFLGFHGFLGDFHGDVMVISADSPSKTQPLGERAKGLTRGKPAEWKGSKEIKYCFFMHLVCHRSGMIMSCWSFVYSLLQMICWSFSIGSTRRGKPHPQTRPKPCHGLGDNLTTGDYFHLLRTTSLGKTFPLWCGGLRWRSDHRKTRGLCHLFGRCHVRGSMSPAAMLWCGAYLLPAGKGEYLSSGERNPSVSMPQVSAADCILPRAGKNTLWFCGHFRKTWECMDLESYGTHSSLSQTESLEKSLRTNNYTPTKD